MTSMITVVASFEHPFETLGSHYPNLNGKQVSREIITL